MRRVGAGVIALRQGGEYVILSLNLSIFVIDLNRVNHTYDGAARRTIREWVASHLSAEQYHLSRIG